MSSTTPAANAQDFTYDPFSPEVMNNPLPFYKILRRDHPVYYIEKYDGYFISRFEDNLELLLHVDNSLLQSEGSLPMPSALQLKNVGAPVRPADNPLMISQRYGLPTHGEVRRAHSKPLTPGAVARLQDFVRQRANERLDILLPKGRFNLTHDYGGIVSASVIMHLMGMPLELAEEALDMINAGTKTDPAEGGLNTGAVAMKVREYFLPYVEARRKAGADGSVPMVDGLFQYRYNGRQLTTDEVATQLVCAFLGGIESVPKVTAHGLMELSDRPEQLAAVRADLDANMPKAAEEMIRFCAPAQWFMRTVHTPVTVAGQTLQPGQRVFLLLASASRDEREFENPDEFQWDRSIRRTLAFGHGMHFCIGIHLARMEVQTLVKTFLQRVPKFHFDKDAAVRPPSSFQWGWNYLPVVIGE